MTYDPDKLRLERELAKPGTYGGVTDQMPFGIRVGHVVKGLAGGNEYRYQHDAEYHAWVEQFARAAIRSVDIRAKAS